MSKIPVKRKNPVIDLDVFDDSELVPDPRDVDISQKNVCVFDDMITDSKLNLAEAYYTRGRHNNISCVYISQSYHMLPRQTIRANSNCLILFKLPIKDLRHIHDDVISSDMSRDEFSKFVHNVWQQQDHNIIVINKERSGEEGKFTVNFEHMYIPEKYISGAGLVNKALRKLPLPEMHLSLPNEVFSEQVTDGSFNTTGKYSYCGPFTKLDHRLSEGYKGVNALDEACMRHDLAYKKYKTTKERNAADDVLAMEAASIALDESKPEYERRDARLVTGIMGTKSRFGLGINSKLNELYYDPRTGYSGGDNLVSRSGLTKNVVQDWLSKQEVYTLHKPIRHKFTTRRVLVSGVDDQWQADLVDMQRYKDKNMKYILTVIDVFSKFARAVPIRNKTGDEITNAFTKLFENRVPRKLHTDKGLEFINKKTQQLLKKLGVHWFTTENETKAQIVERFNCTLKSRMWKYFTAQNTKKWVDILPQLVENYNTSVHRSINMKPADASLKKNEAVVYRKLFPKTKLKSAKAKFAVGNCVRITIKRGDFRKGYRPNFTKEVFVVVQVQSTQPITYKIEALDGEEITVSFYEQEMVKVNTK